MTKRSEVKEPPVSKPSKSKNYFTQETENAIIRYNRATTPEERNLIYNQSLHVPLHKLAENVINTFKFSYFDDTHENVRTEVVSFMMEKVGLFDASKGRAFSYLSIIAKNYLILNNNNNYKRLRIHDKIDAVDASRNFHSEIRAEEQEIENRELIRMMIAFWENNLHAIFKKQRDIQIADAVIELFRRIDGIENFNKKALYLMIREMTGCKTQQITKVVNAMRKYYIDMQQQYHVEGDIDTSNIYSNKFF